MIATDDELGTVAAPPPVAPIGVTTGKPSRSERFVDWHDYCGDVNEIVVTQVAEESFEARSENWHLGPMLLTHNITSATAMLRPSGPARRNRIAPAILRINKAGGTFTRSGNDDSPAGAGTLVLEALRQGCEGRCSASERVTLNIAPSDDPQLWAGLSALGIGPVEGVGARLLADFLLSLAMRMRDVTEADLPAVAELTRTMVAASLAGTSPRFNAAPNSAEVLQRWQADRVIRENIGSARLDVARICELSHISRSTLYRLFEPEGGVAAYTRRLRLDLAHSILGDPERRREPIASVAEQCGYHCVASFNRAFRSAFGCTPGDVRAASRADRGERRREAPRGDSTLPLRDLL